jgi:hypothetical protein
MKKIAYAAFVSTAAIALAACGSSENASEEATPENVEMPAEEAVSGIDATATPVTDPAATAPVDATATGTATATPTDGASAAVDDATADAEKKM